jgi:hypothetical protein
VIYPNPVSEVLTIQMRESNCVRIFDEVGGIVFENCASSRVTNLNRIDVSNWATGIYEVAIYNDANLVVHSESIIVMD